MIAALFAQDRDDFVDRVEPFAGILQGQKHILGHKVLQCLHVAVVPEADNLPGQFDMGVVAFRVHLFAEKMDQAVLPEGNLIHFRGDVAQLAFGADLVIVDRKDAGQLLYHLEDGSDIRIQQLGDIPLEQVRIGDKNSLDTEIYDQGRKQLKHFLGAAFDQFHPDPDVLDVVFVDADLPVLVDAEDISRHEAEGDQPIDEGVDDDRVSQFDHLFAESQNTVQEGSQVTAFLGVEEMEYPVPEK